MSGDQKALKVKEVLTLQVRLPVIFCQSLEDRSQHLSNPCLVGSMRNCDHYTLSSRIIMLYLAY